MSIPELESRCGSWVVSRPDGTVVGETFNRGEVIIAALRGYTVETAMQYLTRINADEKGIETVTTAIQTEQLLAGGKIASSHSPAFHLIPRAALIALANRCQLGVERKGDKAWNAITTGNQHCLTDRELILHRISHVIDHATKLRDRLVAADSTSDYSILAEDDDSAAVMWGGMFLCCAVDAVLSEAAEIDARARMQK